VSSSSVPWTEWTDVPRFSIRYRHLTRAVLGDNYHVGVAIEELPPGMQSSPAHYHIFEEEHVYILEGALTLRLGAATHEMKAGDYVCFPAGQKAGHCLINNSGAVCRYVITGERHPNEVGVYTDTGKVLVRARPARDVRPRGDARLLTARTRASPRASPAIGCRRPRPEAPVKPKPPISVSNLSWKEEGPGEGTQFGGRSKHLTHAAVGENYHVGMLIEAPAPGRRLCPTHYHMLEEEHALILEGQVTLILGDARHDMKPGDYVCFPAGWKIGHSLMNRGPGPCSYLMIGERNPNEVCVYPDSNKMLVSALRTRDDIFDMSGIRNYWDGEQTAEEFARR
jgi:uncharacterized cupin superfamily protein